MNPEFTKEEKKLFNSRDPKDYINKSLKLEIPPGRKAFVTRHWLGKTGYNADDLEYFRNRHPYWKSKKMQGTVERNILRSKEHNYGDGKRKEWDETLIKEFISLNKKDKTRNYTHKDWELARHFKCTIAAIQHMRRKYNMAETIIASQGKMTSKKLVSYLMLGEGTLRRMKQDL